MLYICFSEVMEKQPKQEDKYRKEFDVKNIELKNGK